MVEGSYCLQWISGHTSFIPITSSAGSSLIPVFSRVESHVEANNGLTVSSLGMRLRSGWVLASRMIPGWGEGNSAAHRHMIGSDEEASGSSGLAAGTGDALSSSKSATRVRGGAQVAATREVVAAAAEARIARIASSDLMADNTTRNSGADLRPDTVSKENLTYN